MHKVITHKKPKLLFVVTADWYFCSHRLILARVAKSKGFDVVVVTRVMNHGKQIEEEGFKLIPIGMERSGKSLLKEIVTLWELIGIYKNERPDIVHHVAMKPVLYGSFAALITRVPHVVNALTGMGYMFISSKREAILLRKIVSSAFRILLNRPNSRVILQNPDDQHLMVQSGILNSERIVLIRGSGVDTMEFSPTPEPSGMLTVVLASRLLWDKGVGEFVEAARILCKKGVSARFVLVGDTDPENPAAVPTSQLEDWNRSGIVEWWGRRDDMPHIFSESHIVCLPSYREGLPKVLLEAAACGRAIVTTDVPGCREIVRQGENGLLVPVRDSSALAEALHRLIEDPVLRRHMGENARKIALAEFSVEKVVADTLALYQQLSSKAPIQ